MAGEGMKKELWRFDAGAAVKSIVAADDADTVAVACEDRQVILLDGTGKVTGTFKAGKPLRCVRVDRLGMTFAALSGEAVIYAFDGSGDLEWRVELGGPVVDFSLCQLAEQLAAVSVEGWLYLYSQATRERRVAPVGWPMSSVAIAHTNPLRLVVANKDGRVAFLNEEAKPQWEEDLERPIGPVSVSSGAEVVAVPAGERGVVLFRYGGGEIASINVGEPVRRADISVKGAMIAAETASGRLALYEGETDLKWECSLGVSPVDWSLGRTGTMLAVALERGQVVAFQTGEAPAGAARPAAEPEAEPEGPPAPELTPEEAEEQVARVLAARRGGRPARAEEQGEEPQEAAAQPQEAGDEVDLFEYMEVEDALEGGPAGPAVAKPAEPKKGLVHWKKKLPPDVAPTAAENLRLSTDGRHTVVLYTDGRIVVLDAEGNWALQSRTSMPAALVAARPTSAVAAWCARELVILNMASLSVRAVLLGRRNIKHLAASADVSICCAIDAADKLRAFVGDDELPTWKRAISGGVTGLHISPNGRTILVPDATGRFRYFDAEGNLVRKFRFADAGDHVVLGQADSFTVFVTSDGRVTVLDLSGGELMVRRIFRTVSGCEVLGESFAVYGEEGECAIVAPHEDVVWEFRPPPGRARARRPADADPVVVHSLNDVVTVFTGYKRKLDVAWRYSCSGDIVALDADDQAQTIVALADQKVYRLGAE